MLISSLTYKIPTMQSALALSESAYVVAQVTVWNN